jgi:hypothetical protein
LQLCPPHQNQHHQDALQPPKFSSLAKLVRDAQLLRGDKRQCRQKITTE